MAVRRDDPSPHPLRPRPAQEVHVYTTAAPTVAYVEVGILQSRQSSGLSTHAMPEIIGEMRAEAGAIGCEGVILNGAADKNESSLYADPDTVAASSSTLEGFWGACIVYLDDGAPEATASR